MSKKPYKFKGWVKGLLWGLSGATVLVMGSLIWLQTSSGRDWVTGQIEGALAGRQGTADIAELKGNPLSLFEIHGVTVGDKEGVWLTAQSIAIDWNSGALLFGEISINSLTSENIQLLRFPAPEEKQQDEPIKLPNLKVGTLGLTIKTDLGSLDANPILYQVEAQGIDLDDDHVFGSLKLSPESGAGDALNLTLAWEKGSNALTLEGSVTGSRGGFVEGVLGLPGAGPIQINVLGKGAIKTWDGAVSFAFGNGWSMQADLKGAGENILGVAGKIEYPASRLDPWKSLLGTVSNFNGQVGVEDLLHPEIKASITFPGAMADIDGVFNPTGGKLLDGMTFKVTAPKIIIPSGEEGSHILNNLEASGSTEGVPARVVASGGFSFKRATGPVLGLGSSQGSFMVAPTGPQLAFTLTGDGADFSAQIGDEKIASQQAHWDLAGAVDNAAGHFDLEIKAFDLDETTLSGQARFDLELNPKAFALSGQLSSTLIGQWLGFEGWLGQTTFTTSLDQETLKLNASFSELSTQDEVLNSLLGPKPALKMNGQWQAEGEIDLVEGHLTGTNLDLAVTGTKNGPQLAFDYVAGLKSLKGIVPEAVSLDGGVVITGKFFGQATNPSLSAATRISLVDVYGFLIKDLDFYLTLEALSETPTGTVTLIGSSQFGNLRGLSKITLLDQGGLSLRNISAGVSSLSLTGDLYLAEGGVKGQLTGLFGKTEVFLPGVGFQGKGSLKLGFDLKDKLQGLKFQSDLMDIIIREESGQINEIAKLIGTGSLVFKNTGPEGLLDLTLEGFYRGALGVDNLILKGPVGRNASLKLKGEGTYYNPFQFSGKALAQERPGGFELGITLGAEFGGRKIETTAPITLQILEQSLSFVIPDLTIGEGTLNATYQKTNDDQHLSAKATKVDVVLLTIPWPGLVSAGILNGNLSWESTKAKETLDAVFEATGLRHQGLFDIEEAPFSIGVSANAGEGDFNFDGTLRTGGINVGHFNVQLKYDREEGLRIMPEEAITANLKWDGPVEPLWAFSRLYDHDLSGRLVSDLSITGTLTDPVFNGSARLENGNYSYLPSGMTLKEIALMLSGSGDKLTIKSLVASDGMGGEVRLNGGFEITPQLTFPGRLNIEASSLHFVRLDNISASASGNLVYSRVEEGEKLEGMVTTGRIEAEIAQRLPRSVVNIEVREINQTEIFTPQVRNPAQPRVPVALDLKVKIPNQFFVRGRGLESEWGGDLTVTGRSDQPRIAGRLDLIRGNFDFAGKRFVLESGRLGFDGGGEVDPDILLISRTRTPTVSAEIQISGKLSSPQLTMNSTPAMPEDEILSHLLFGKSIGDLGPLQLAELASALATISGNGSGLNVLSTARKGLGLDTLSFTSDSVSGSGTLITGGKYLTRDVYLEVEAATATGETVTRLLYDITSWLRAESEVSQKKGSSLKLKWFWDY